MTTRLLPPAEWDRLQGTELGPVAQILPETARVIVVEDEAGAIVGCWSVFQVVHVEGLWIAPANRGKGSVARRLLVEMRKQARDFGARAVMTAAITPDVRALIESVGGSQVPGEHFVMPLENV